MGVGSVNLTLLCAITTDLAAPAQHNSSAQPVAPSVICTIGWCVCAAVCECVCVCVCVYALHSTAPGYTRRYECTCMWLTLMTPQMLSTEEYLYVLRHLFSSLSPSLPPFPPPSLPSLSLLLYSPPLLPVASGSVSLVLWSWEEGEQNRNYRGQKSHGCANKSTRLISKGAQVLKKGIAPFPCPPLKTSTCDHTLLHGDIVTTNVWYICGLIKSQSVANGNYSAVPKSL